MSTTVWFGLVLLGAVFAAEPDKCCFDNQYTVITGEVGEVLTNDPHNATFIDDYKYIGFDFYNMRQGYILVYTRADGSTTKSYILKDYMHRKIYSKKDNNTCYYTDMEPWDQQRPSCIPDDARFAGKKVFGYGHNKLTVNTWKFNYTMPMFGNSLFIMAVTEEHCVPVLDVVVATVAGGRKVEMSHFYVGYHPGVEHLDDLEIPQGCQPGHIAGQGL